MMERTDVRLRTDGESCFGRSGPSHVADVALFALTVRPVESPMGLTRRGDAGRTAVRNGVHDGRCVLRGGQPLGSSRPEWLPKK